MFFFFSESGYGYGYWQGYGQSYGKVGYGQGYGYGGYGNRYCYHYYSKRGMKKIASNKRANNVHAELNDDARIEHLKEKLAQWSRAYSKVH